MGMPLRVTIKDRPTPSKPGLEPTPERSRRVGAPCESQTVTRSLKPGCQIYFLCSSFTLAVMGWPSRRTFTSTTCPTLLRRSASVKS